VPRDTPAVIILPNPSVRIFIVEDSDVTRSALRAILGQEADFQLAGEAVDGKTAVSRLLAAKPDVALVDIGLPGASGIDVTRQFKKQAPNIKALMFTSNNDDRLMLESFSAGADGYMLKEGFDRLLLSKAIRSVVQGKCWLDPDIANRILKFAKMFNQPVPSAVTSARIEPLTQQEEQVLNAAGSTDGVCAVKPDFLSRLQRFSRIDEKK
jgi:two-component system, NarL family, response regulator DevR